MNEYVMAFLIFAAIALVVTTMFLSTLYTKWFYNLGKLPPKSILEVSNFGRYRVKIAFTDRGEYYLGERDSRMEAIDDAWGIYYDCQRKKIPIEWEKIAENTKEEK